MDCGSHYKYIATYVDEILCFGKDPMATIMELKQDYILKELAVPNTTSGVI